MFLTCSSTEEEEIALNIRVQMADGGDNEEVVDDGRLWEQELHRGEQ